MPARLFSVIGMTLIALGLTSQASAEILCDAWNSVVKDVKRRQCWPEPFVHADRVAARTPFAMQVSNGWRRQNMLSEFHFLPGTQQLTEAGQIKIRWILTACPEQHRTIYIHMADNEEDTAARMAIVQQCAAKISPNNIPPILTTSIPDEGWSADEVDQVGRKYQSTMPPPRLPTPASGSGFGMGGNGSSN
jgi:hypothetical protein